MILDVLQLGPVVGNMYFHGRAEPTYTIKQPYALRSDKIASQEVAYERIDLLGSFVEERQ